MSTTLNAAVIGVGHLGQHHARIYAEHPECSLIGIVDANDEQAKKIASKHGTSVVSDFTSLLGKVDAVSIATPTVYHHEIARFFLSHGVHVLVEKPITKTIEEAEELVKIANEKNIILQVGHLERFNAAFVEARQFIKNPGFIETQRLGSFSPRSLDIDVVLDLMIHDIDILLSIEKSPITFIHAVGVPVLTPKIDIANVRLIFESGCVANLTASRASLEQVRKIRIFQKDLYLSIDYASQNTFYCRTILPDPSKGELLPKIDKQIVPVAQKEPLKAEIVAFLESIQSQKAPVVSGDDGLAALRVAHEILSQMENPPKFTKN